MPRPRSRAIGPVGLLLVAALLIVGAVAMRSVLVAPTNHRVLMNAPAAVQPNSVTAKTQSPPEGKSEPAAPASQPQSAQDSHPQVPSQVRLEAKGAQRQPPAGQYCGSMLEVCPDQ